MRIGTMLAKKERASEQVSLFQSEVLAFAMSSNVHVMRNQ